MSLAKVLEKAGILKEVKKASGYDVGKVCNIEIHVDGYGEAEISANGSNAALIAAAAAYIDALFQNDVMDINDLKFVYDFFKEQHEDKEE